MSRPATRSQWEGEGAKPIAAIHILAGAALAQILAVPPSYPLIDMSPNRPVGPAARIARVAECGHGNSAHGRYRAESQSEPTLFVQGPPILPSHVPAPSPGNGPDYLSLGRSIGSNAIGRMVGDTAKLTKRSPRRHRQRRLRTVPAAIFTAPLRRSLSNYRRLLTPCRHKTVGVRERNLWSVQRDWRFSLR